MPELPEVESLADYLRRTATGLRVARVELAAINALKTFDPPVRALEGRRLVDVTRHGKFLDLVFVDEDGQALHLITHLARAGWLHWRESLPPAPPRPGGKGPIAFRLHLAPEFPDGPVSGFDLTEAGTQRRLGVWVVHDPTEVPGVARLGPDALALDLAGFAALLAGHRERLKTVLTDQSVLAGIGNAYSDEILHTARLSPFATAGSLGDEAVARLHGALRSVLTDAVTRSVGQGAATLKAEKRSGLRVHARTGMPCPVCGDTVRQVAYATKNFQYCPTCQTGGKPLADRRMSRLLR